MTAHAEALRTSQLVAQAALDKKADNIRIIDVSDRLAITDCFVLASADNERHVNAIVEGVEEHLQNKGLTPTRREGTQEGRWVLLDYVDVIVHVQHSEEREFYNLDNLWKDCPIIDIDPESTATATTVDNANEGKDDA